LTQRRSAALAVAVTLCAFAGIPAHAAADDNSSISLTITSQDTAAGTSTSAASASASVKHFHKKSRRSTSRRSRYPAVSRGGMRIPATPTVLRVVTITSDTAQIMGGRDRYGRVLSTCEKGTYLAVSGQTEDQYAVIMIDHSLGFINKSDVQLLDYQIVNKETGDPITAGSPGGAPGSLGNQMVQASYSYLNVPYVWGGNTKEGIDCSGFVKAVYAQFGINLPRHSGDQATVGTDVPIDQVNLWQPGDRMYFACHHPEIDHTAMYIGNGYFIHASAGHGHQVAVDPVSNSYYYSHLVCVKRSPEVGVASTASYAAVAPTEQAAAPEPGITTVRGTTTTTTRISIPQDQVAAGDTESGQQ